MKLDTQQEMAAMYFVGVDTLADLEINIETDEFMIVQPFDNGNVIILEVVEEDGERIVKQRVFDGCVVLPKKDGTLNVFN
ncbi:hypothetical protein ABQD61_06855 [Enterococcus asini]|uniref:hypothetical protein n=1 Tax=Enterococcus asini TaxID=57732 RepID=UPI0032E45D35